MGESVTAARPARARGSRPAGRISRVPIIVFVVAALLAVERGARIVRVHDVRDTVAALKVWSAARQDTRERTRETP